MRHSQGQPVAAHRAAGLAASARQDSSAMMQASAGLLTTPASAAGTWGALLNLAERKGRSTTHTYIGRLQCGQLAVAFALHTCLADCFNHSGDSCACFATSAPAEAAILPLQTSVSRFSWCRLCAPSLSGSLATQARRARSWRISSTSYNTLRCVWGLLLRPHKLFGEVLAVLAQVALYKGAGGWQPTVPTAQQAVMV